MEAGSGDGLVMNALLAGLAILILGDSHMVERDYLITTLHDDLVAQGATVDTYGMCGASAGDWVSPATISCGRAERHGDNAPQIEQSESSAWKLDDLVAKHHPDLIVIEMGDAMAGYGQATMPRAWIYQQVRTLTGRIAAQNIPCAWVGPPWGSEGSSYPKTFARVREMSDFLSTAVAPCHFIDSTQFSAQGEWLTIDGKHLTETGYRAWGADIAAAVDRLASQLPRKQ
jgi:hypothetical protein